MKRYLYILLSCVILSCNSEQDTQQNLPNPVELEIIKIEIARAFMGQSVVYLNLTNNSILISKINMVCSPPNIDPDYYLTPNEEYFRISSSEKETIRDSVLHGFALIDYESVINKGFDDGFFINVLISYSNDSVVQYDLQNGMTVNQQVLLSNVIEQTLSHTKDSVNILYFTKIYETINRSSIVRNIH